MTQLMQTADGSPTLYVPELDEHYHSVNGAVQEAEHVYIGAGLAAALRRPLAEVRLFELGFGTGLNALLTWHYLQQNSPEMPLFYEAIEKYPLEKSLVEEYLTALDVAPDLQTIFRALHAAPWDQPVQITPRFTLLKRNGSFETATVTPGSYDVVYFDAFAPQKQPELWTEEILTKAGNLLASEAVIVTYCARGALKRTWRAAGLQVETLPGAPGKREMVRARRPGERNAGS